jgi:hypothetical protein
VKRLLVALALVVLVAVGTVSTTDAARRAPTVITGTFEDVSFNLPSAACPATTLFEADFSLVSPAGKQLGTGVSCVQGFAGDPCPDPAPIGCRETVLAIFVFTFADGSITAPVQLDETNVPDGVVQHSRGQITGGTGVYAGAGGTVQHVGLLGFTTPGRLTFIAVIT